MANEFGNVGAVSNLSKIRLSNKQFEVASPEGAEYEAFYGGYWRDISSDFRYDVSKAGNSFARCIRWDDGFRSYRVDRGLIIRKKEDSDDDDDSKTNRTFGSFLIDDDGGAETLKNFGKSAAISFGISLGTQSFKKYLEPVILKTALGKAFTTKPLSGVGKFLGENKVTLAFTAFNLFQDTGQTNSEKLAQAATSIAVGYAVRKVAGPYSFLVGASIGVVKSIFNGNSVDNATGGAIGNIVGGQLGKSVGANLFQSKSYNKGTTVDLTGKNSTQQYKLLEKGSGAEVYKKVNYPYPSTASEVIPTSNMFQRSTNIVNEALREQESRNENISAAASSKRIKSLKKLSKSLNSQRDRNRKGRVF
jgi:hypothetical protein